MFRYKRVTMLPVSALLLLGFSVAAFAQGGRAPYQPVVVETAWGQHVVPDLWTYLDMEVYAQLKPGEKWSAGDAIRKKIYADYQAGRLKLRRFPWKVVEGIYALGRDDQGQLTYLLDTGKGLLHPHRSCGIGGGGRNVSEGGTAAHGDGGGGISADPPCDVESGLAADCTVDAPVSAGDRPLDDGDVFSFIFLNRLFFGLFGLMTGSGHDRLVVFQRAQI